MPCAATWAQLSIPKSHGTTLAGAAVTLPEALGESAGIMVVGFSHASQGQVAAWGRRLTADYGQSQNVKYFELPMLAGAPKILRGMIVKKMASTVPQAERPHFLPLMEGEAAWRAVAHYDKPDDAYLMLVNGAGEVQWQTEGDATDAAYAELKKNLQELSMHGGSQ